MMARDDYDRAVRQLCHASTTKQHDAFRDVPWPAAGEPPIDPRDPSFALAEDHPLAATDWYRSLGAGQQAHFGLVHLTQTLKYGISFEAVLSQGLLEFARSRPNRSLEYRYAMHELIEESQHSLMFQEFIDRTGADPRPFTGVDAFFDRRVPILGRFFPELFFGLVLAGEIFVDRDNRKALRNPNLHPLYRRVIQIHVTEEARHLHFARRFLQDRLPQLSPARRSAIAWALPFSLVDSARKMLQPAPHVVRQFGIPKAALRAAFGAGTPYRAEVERVVAPVAELLRAHDMFGPAQQWYWRRLGLISALSPVPPAAARRTLLISDATPAGAIARSTGPR